MMLALTWVSASYAADPKAFIIQTSPATFGTNEAVDLTIQAVDENGAIVPSYLGDVFIELPEISDATQYTLPSDGVYSFLAQDQWKKTFSKWLIIKKAGTYKLKVNDVINDSIKWETTIIVGGGNQSVPQSVSINSPVSWGLEKNASINVVATSLSPNSPVHVFINGLKVKEELTNSNGDITLFLSNVVSGSNTLQLKIVDVNGSPIAQSQELTFQYSPVTDQLYKGLTISPSNTVTNVQKVTFTVSTDPAVSSAQVVLNNQITYPLDKTKYGEFSKTLQLWLTGQFQVWVILSAQGTQRNYDGLDSLTVTPAQKIINQVKTIFDAVDPSNLAVSWTLLDGQSAPMYKVQYGTDPSQLDQFLQTTTTGVQVTGLLLSTKYFLTIQGLDSNWLAFGQPSDVITIEPAQPSAPLCKVEGIRLWTEKKAGKYYLAWDVVDGADKYIVYRSTDPDATLDQMQVVGETSSTDFEYPFDPTLDHKEYAYYSVQAVCSDGAGVMIDSVKKVQTGPAENILLILIFASIVYFSRKLYLSSSIKN